MEIEQHGLSLQRASDYCGIQNEFWDIFGRHHTASQQARQAIVTSLGFDAGQLDEELAAREFARWSRLVESCVVTRDGKFSVHLPESHQDAALTIEVRLEGGDAASHVVHLASLPRYGRGGFSGAALHPQAVRFSGGLSVGLSQSDLFGSWSSAGQYAADRGSFAGLHSALSGKRR